MAGLLQRQLNKQGKVRDGKDFEQTRLDSHRRQITKIVIVEEPSGSWNAEIRELVNAQVNIRYNQQHVERVMT
jgi:hypothetical protein